MLNEERRFSSLRIDIESVLKPFDQERKYLQELRQSASIEPILSRLFDLLNPEDYRLLFSTINRQQLTCKWLETFSKLCMQRYLELDDIAFSEKKTPNPVQGTSILANYIDHLIDEFKSCFSIHYCHAILCELEELNHFKIKQISKHVQENNALMQKLFSQIQTTQHQPEQQQEQNSQDDVAIIHLSSTPAQPIYLSYKPVHMIYLRTKLLVRNDHDDQHLPSEGISKTFVSDLIHTKRIQILHETNGRTYDVPAKWLYFAQPCEPNIILPLKLRVLILDGQTGQRRYGIIGEEPGKNNHYRCLIFFTDDKRNLSASYHSPSDVHLCLDQICPISDIDDEHEFLSCYFKSYPERLMLRAKEGTLIRIRSAVPNSRNVFLQAMVLLIDCSMMLIEVSQTRQQLWIYRGSTLIEQMNNYYSNQNQAEKNLYIRHSARQHLSARKTNAPEIICLNEQTKIKSIRTADQAVDESKTIKRPRISPEKALNKSAPVLPTLPSREQDAPSALLSSNALVTIVQPRLHQSNGNSRIVINPIFLELAEQFLLHYSRDFFPHECSYRCVMYAEKYFHQLPRTMNPFLKPFACHWTTLESLRIRKANDVRLKTARGLIIYCAPCGRKLCNEAQVDCYLHATKSKLSIELFVFDSAVNLKPLYTTEGELISSDISDGQENVPISAVNEVDHEQPSHFTYRVERTPVEGVKMITNEPTMTCCSCTDGCRDRTQCACWLRTLKYAELVGDDRVKGMQAKHKSQAEILYQLGYGFRRLHKNVPGGIYECNNRCSCHQHTCSNRVVQNGIIAQLQLFKTVGRGWGVRTLHDLPLGTFVSVYSGEIFTSEQADERGKLIGDEYQADLDFFENINNDSDEDSDDNDGRSSRLEEEEEEEENKVPPTVQRRSRNSAPQAQSHELKTRANSRRVNECVDSDKTNSSVLNRTLLPDYDGVVYTLDAKVIGNVGRYFNHSCSPNIAVQNVFVDTHDIHFPWIGFFTTKTIRAGTELCWDYNYTVGEIAGRRMDCNCGSTECRRRVL